MAGDILSAVAYLKAEPPDDGRPVLSLAQDDAPIIRPLPAGLQVAYLIDAGDHFEYVQGRVLDAADLTPDELHELALKNLASFAERRAEVRSYGSIYVVIAGGNFEASFLLVDHFWTEWYAELAPNGFVAAVPARDILAFGDAESAAAIHELEAVVTRAAASGADHPLTPRLLHRSESGWTPRSAIEGGARVAAPSPPLCPPHCP